MTRRRRWIIVAGGLATVLVAAVGVLREASYGGRLPPEVRSRMPAHWRTPWFVGSDVSRAIDNLYSPDHAARAAAASALVDLGPRAEPAVPFLVAALADFEPDRRQNPPEPEPETLWTRLMGYVSGPAPESRWPENHDYAAENAAAALAEAGEPAVDALIAALKDPLPEVRAGAAAALGEIGDERAIDALAAAPWDTSHRNYVHEGGDTPCPEAKALAAIGGRGIDILIERMRDPDKRTRQMAVMALGDCRGECPRAVEALAPVLEDLEKWVARSAANALGRLPGDRARDLVIAALNSKVDWVREEAAGALSGRRGRRVVDALVAVMERGREPEAKEAVRSLRRIGDPRAFEPLLAWLGRASPDDRSDVVYALETFRDPRAVPALLALAQTDKDYGGYTAVYALGEIGGLEAADALAKLLKDERFRADAAIALGRRGDTRAVPNLIREMKTGNEYARVHASADAIVAIGPPAVEPLVEALQDSRCDLWAAKDLGRIGDKRAFEPLLAITRSDKNPYLRAAAARSLGRLGDSRAYEPLVEMLQAAGPKDVVMAHAAAEGLGYLGDARAVGPILAYLNRFDMSATIHLKLGDYTGVIHLYEDHATETAPTADIFTGVALALLRLGDPRGLDVFNCARPKTTWDTLHPLYPDGPLVLGPAGIKVFSTALADARPQVRHAAAVALVTEGSPEVVAAVVAAYPLLPAETRRLLLAEIAHHTRCPDVTAVLAGALATDRDRLVRIAAAGELGARGDPVAAEALRRAAAEDPLRCVRKVAAEELESLLRRNPPGIDPPRWQTRHELLGP